MNRMNVWALLSASCLAVGALAGCGGQAAPPQASPGAPSPSAVVSSGQPASPASSGPAEPSGVEQAFVGAQLPGTVQNPGSAVQPTEVVTDAEAASDLLEPSEEQIPVDGTVVSPILENWRNLGERLLAERSQLPGAAGTVAVFFGTMAGEKVGYARSLSFSTSDEKAAWAQQPGTYILEVTCYATEPVDYAAGGIIDGRPRFAVKGTCGVNEAVRMEHPFTAATQEDVLTSVGFLASKTVPGFAVVVVRDAKDQ